MIRQVFACVSDGGTTSGSVNDMTTSMGDLTL